jgi:hypothetical protein
MYVGPMDGENTQEVPCGGENAVVEESSIVDLVDGEHYHVDPCSARNPNGYRVVGKHASVGSLVLENTVHLIVEENNGIFNIPRDRLS